MQVSGVEGEQGDIKTALSDTCKTENVAKLMAVIFIHVPNRSQSIHTIKIISLLMIVISGSARSLGSRLRRVLREAT